MNEQDRAAYLLSRAALPKAEIPRHEDHRPRRFRLPTCVQPKIAVPKRAKPEPVVAHGEATTMWFKQGEELEIDDLDIIVEEEEPALLRRRFGTIGWVSLAAFGGALVILAVRLFP